MVLRRSPKYPIECIIVGDRRNRGESNFGANLKIRIQKDGTTEIQAHIVEEVSRMMDKAIEFNQKVMGREISSDPTKTIDEQGKQKSIPLGK